MNKDYKLDSQILASQENSLDSAFIEAAELVLSSYSREDALAKVRDNYYGRQEALSKCEFVEQNGEITFHDSSLNYNTADNPPQQILAIANELKSSHGNFLE